MKKLKVLNILISDFFNSKIVRFVLIFLVSISSFALILYELDVKVPVVVMSGVLGSFITLLGVMVSNHYSRENLNIQLNHQRESFEKQLQSQNFILEKQLAHQSLEKEKERIYNSKMELYKAFIEKISSIEMLCANVCVGICDKELEDDIIKNIYILINSICFLIGWDKFDVVGKEYENIKNIYSKLKEKYDGIIEARENAMQARLKYTENLKELNGLFFKRFLNENDVGLIDEIKRVEVLNKKLKIYAVKITDDYNDQCTKALLHYDSLRPTIEKSRNIILGFFNIDIGVN